MNPRSDVPGPAADDEPFDDPSVNPEVVSQAVRTAARELGFDLVGIAPAISPDGRHRLAEWVAAGFAGEMEYIPRRLAAYDHPESVLPNVRSLIVLGACYGGSQSDQQRARESAKEPSPVEMQSARVAAYAQGAGDYHDVLRGQMKKLARLLHQWLPEARTRGVVDTAPILEREFGRLAGLGWFGKNTMLINKHRGSYFFLSALLTDAELAYDAPHESSHCGTCTRCLEACPTDAFPEPGVLDATRCIAYLTIELRNHPIPEGLRQGVGEWLFGCDVCQDVCPWNRKAGATQWSEFEPQSWPARPDLAWMLALDDEAFKAEFQGTPLYRTGRAALVRNTLIVAGNTARQDLLPAMIASLHDGDPLVRGAAAWSIGRVGRHEAAEALQSRLNVENNASVLDELRNAIDCLRIK